MLLFAHLLHRLVSRSFEKRPVFETFHSLQTGIFDKERGRKRSGSIKGGAIFKRSGRAFNAAPFGNGKVTGYFERARRERRGQLKARSGG